MDVKLLWTNKKIIKNQVSETYWNIQNTFITKLNLIQNAICANVKFIKYNEPIKCVICNKDIISHGYYSYKNYNWDEGLIYYIKNHNLRVDNNFVNFILDIKTDCLENTIKYKGKIYKQKSLDFIKLTRNNILVLDALLDHGGYNKKYFCKGDKKIYTEHLGMLDFHKRQLVKIIISANTQIIYKDDPTIFFHDNPINLFDYEYFFHTHPPTPCPGGRASEGILYEFPSVEDIVHYVHNYNKGKTIGSIILAAEGLYNIHKIKLDKKKININYKNFFKDMTKIYRKVQTMAIAKYTTNFTNDVFFEKISQDRTFIDIINDKLKDYELTIDYHSRIFVENSWIIDNIYLPIMEID